MTIAALCTSCRNTFSLDVARIDHDRWKDGCSVQVAFPYLTAAERELLISKTCGACFDKLCADGEDDD